jgi:hypothetical protein
VSVIVSELRRSSSELYGPYHVVDCVVHTSILAKQDPVYRTQLIDLCFTCVKEVLGVDINRGSPYEIKMATYMEPWGWNSDGSPISDSNPPEEIDSTPLESMTTSSLLQDLANSSTETLDEESIVENEPSRGVWIEEIEDCRNSQDVRHNAQDDSQNAEEEEQEVLPEKGLASSLTPEEFHDSLGPEHECVAQKDSIILEVLLPNISSGKEAECYVNHHDHLFHLRTLDNVYNLTLDLNENMYIVSIQFSRQMKVLRVVFKS